MIKYVLGLLALLYALSPYDILPDFAIGWGWLDDLVILYLVWRFISAQQKGRDAFRSRFENRAFENERRGPSSQTGPATEPSGPKDPYTVLRIQRNASPEEIKQAYRRLAGKYHPDKVQHLGEEFRKLAEERFKEIEAAYRELTDKR